VEVSLDPQGHRYVVARTGWFCDYRTGFFAYRLFAMTCILQNSLSPSSLNSMPIPEFLMTAEWNVGMEIEVLIDPNHPGIKPTCNGVQ
jgi:hypothetical protein